MAKENQPVKKPAETAAPRTFTQEEMDRALFLERYLAWHTVSVQRSAQFGDLQVWVDAANAVKSLLLAPPQKPAQPPTDTKVAEDLYEEGSPEE